VNKISFGIVGLFGILMPGALLLVNIFVPLSAMHDSLDWFKGNAGYKMDTVIIIVLILLAFTVGTILRTLPPRSAEWIYRRFSKWNFYNILIAYLEIPKRELFSSIPDDVWDKHYDPKKVEEKRKHWRHMRLFNFAKNYVIANSERLALEVQTAEGLSRFMASVFWCSLAGLVISGFSFFNILISNKSEDCLYIAIYFLFANLLLFIGSTRGVGTIREHEVEVVMQSFFCLHLPEKKGKNNDGNV
jgi:hypothetical protein